jgi:dihydroxyacetone kinase-like protein
MSIRATGPTAALEVRTVEGEAAVAAVAAFIRRAAVLIDRHAARLDRLDVALGDGDHGTNMSIGFRATLRSLEEMPMSERPSDVGTLLRLVGHGLVSSVGGASGPLYGTAFIEAGFFLGGTDRIDTQVAADALEVGTRALARRGRSAVGDKTILDALAPASTSLRHSAEMGRSMPIAFREAAHAAAAGMRATIPLIARRGLALRLGERSRGHRDPGAASCFLLLVALATLDRSERTPG